MQLTKAIKQLKRGELFTLKYIEGEPLDSQIWVRGDFDRVTKKYSCTNWGDINRERFFKGDKEIYFI